MKISYPMLIAATCALAVLPFSSVALGEERAPQVAQEAERNKVATFAELDFNQSENPLPDDVYRYVDHVRINLGGKKSNRNDLVVLLEQTGRIDKERAVVVYYNVDLTTLEYGEAPQKMTRVISGPLGSSEKISLSAIRGKSKDSFKVNRVSGYEGDRETLSLIFGNRESCASDQSLPICLVGASRNYENRASSWSANTVSGTYKARRGSRKPVSGKSGKIADFSKIRFQDLTEDNLADLESLTLNH